MFQFLIGTLKTQVDALARQYPPRVSIPHRYAKNTAAGSYDLFAAVFQFLIGTLKTVIATPVTRTAVICFNSS